MIIILIIIEPANQESIRALGENIVSGHPQTSGDERKDEQKASQSQTL